MTLKLKKGEVVVAVIPNSKYAKKSVSTTKDCTKSCKSLIYVSLNKLFDPLQKDLKKAKINTDRILFIDGITKSAQDDVAEADNCIYLNSASSLTSISIALNKALATGQFDGIVFDSLSTVLIYNKPASVSRFVHNIVNKAKRSDTKAIFTILKGDAETQLLKEIGLFVDRIVQVK